MPKLEHDEEEFDPTTHTLSDTAKTNLTNKLGTGGSATPSASTNPFSPSQSATNNGTALAQQNSFTGIGGGTSSFGGTGTTSGFGTNSFGNTNAGFGSSTGLNNQQAQGVAAGGTTTLETDKGFGDFINSKWRPLMAVIYMITCTTDFVIFPVLWSVLQAMSHGQVTSQWQPLTLQGGGLVHIAFGAIIGITSWGRSKEKLAGKA